MYLVYSKETGNIWRGVEAYENDNGTIRAGTKESKNIIYPAAAGVDVLKITAKEYKACTPLENYIVQDGKLVIRAEIAEEGES